VQRHPRVVVAETDPDGDGHGSMAVARALRDAGFEVVDAGRAGSPGPVAATALQEDAEAVVLVATPDDDRNLPVPPDQVVAVLATSGLDDVVVVACGTSAGDVAGIAARVGSSIDAREATPAE
jgi:methylmalonyl-CoA mutase cobalamin-binding domain/chain